MRLYRKNFAVKGWGHDISMLKFVHIYKNYFFGLSLIGILAFAIQEIPYIIMPLVKPL